MNNVWANVLVQTVSSMTTVPSGKLQHKVDYLVNSEGCKMCQVSRTENHVKFV